MKTWEWVALGGAAAAAVAAYWVATRGSSPAVTGPQGQSVLGATSALGDPSPLPVGTSSADGAWYVAQTRMGQKYWAAGPNPFTTPQAKQFAASLFSGIVR